ncbi:MAG: 2-oxo acid dehydrogenase subunit E2, partial [Microbacterium sp.]|nr:2-oxo acid dehydrogenase subunit E2 [Microbacterium sp.]
MIAEFRLPDLGEGLTEAEVVQWLVAPGEQVALNQTLAEVETAKAVVELPSPYEGTVAELHADAGETVAVGSPLIAFEVVGEEADASAPTAGAERAQPNLVGYGAAPSTSGRPARRARRAATSVPVIDAAVIEAAPHDASPSVTAEPPVVERPRSTPPVRAYAKRAGVDLAVVAAVVGDRLITRADIDSFASTAADAGGRTVAA